MALLHFPILNSSVDLDCENITFKVSSRSKKKFILYKDIFLGYSVVL